jgi:hypothetical protein
MVAEELKVRNADIPYNLRDPLEILGERDFQPAKRVPEDVKVRTTDILREPANRSVSDSNNAYIWTVPHQYFCSAGFELQQRYTDKNEKWTNDHVLEIQMPISSEAIFHGCKKHGPTGT